MGRWWAELPGRLFGPMFALDAARVGRRISTFAVRWGYLIVLGFILGIFFTSWSGDLGDARGVASPAELARFAESFFWVYAVSQFLFVVAVTPSFTAAAITDEKERRTLDFLLVTDLSGREIAFGKLAARVGALGMLVLAGLPILSLIQFFGGIDPELLLLAAGVTLATVLSLAAVSIAGSVALNRTRDAVVLAYAVPLAYVILSGWWASEGGEGSETFAIANPFVLMTKLTVATLRGAGRDTGTEAAVWYIGVHLAVAAVGITFAAARLRASARAVGGAREPRGHLRRMIAWATGHRTNARPHPPVGNDPVRWREAHVEPGSRSGVLSRLVTVGVLILIAYPFLVIVGDTLLGSSPYWGSRGDPIKQFQDGVQAWVAGVTGSLGMLMLLRAAVRGASAIAGERDRDTWVSLMGTPLTCREILYGKWWGCIWGQRGALLLLASVWAVGILTGSANPFMLALDAVALAVYLAVFAAIGLRCSVSARSARIAIARAVPLAILAGGGFWLPLFCCGMIMSLGGRGSGEPLGYIAAFIAGGTPPFLLTALAAVDFKAINGMMNSRWGDALAFWSVSCGAIFGTIGWAFAAAGLLGATHAALKTEGNRSLAER